MMVYELMNSNIKTLNKNATILDAMKIMKDEQKGIIVIVENNKVLGILTDRDILLLLAKELSPNTNICKVMKKYVFTISHTASISDASDLMGQMQVKNLVVIDEYRNYLGVLFLKDLATNPLTEEYAFDAFIEISYEFSTDYKEIDNIRELSAFIF